MLTLHDCLFEQFLQFLLVTHLKKNCQRWVNLWVTVPLDKFREGPGDVVAGKLVKQAEIRGNALKHEPGSQGSLGGSVEPSSQGNVALEPIARSFHCLEPRCFLAEEPAAVNVLLWSPESKVIKLKSIIFGAQSLLLWFLLKCTVIEVVKFWMPNVLA